MRSTVDELIRHAPFDLYGLDSTFDGSRWASSWQVNRDFSPGMITFAHGSPADDSFFVEVAVWQKDNSIDIYDTLVEALIAKTHSGAGDSFADWRRAVVSTLAPGEWSPIDVPVCNSTHRFQSLAFQNHWVAVSDMQDFWLCILARHATPAEISLDIVRDRELYIAGSKLYGPSLSLLSP